jgi:uncharacterized protein YjbI with pentapeptide repeats
MITPRPAPVRPRVRSPHTNELVLLEDLIELCARAGRTTAIEIIGGPRSGKTTALSHLASLPIAERLLLVDDPGPLPAPSRVADRMIVYAVRQKLIPGALVCELAPWSEDDLVEYLLAVHPGRCSSVVARFLADRNRGLLEGKPELYRAAADQMAASESANDLRTALRLAVAERSQNAETLDSARFFATAGLLDEPQLAMETARHMLDRGAADEALFHLLGYRWVRMLLAADRIAAVLTEKNLTYSFPRRRMPKELVGEAAAIVAHDRRARLRLKELAESGTECVPMAASILHAADPSWRPDRERCSKLHGAYFYRATWTGIDLREANLSSADLRGAALQGANLRGSRLTQAKLRASNLEGAWLENVKAAHADFGHARLARARLTRGRFVGARFAGAVLDEISAEGAKFRDAVFQGASLCSANLERCDLRGAHLDGAVLSNANLRRADLSKLVLQDATLHDAKFASANLSNCDLEYVELPRARFAGADLSRAWLTGSVMLGGDFRGASLFEAGLADIVWEEADLRGADLRGCSFHLGSSRSGLVGSPYPCHGTRTGFYTNDYDDQTYKAPEEIRKASLCGADLRGARIDGVDFYLVDLRGAKYDPRQAEHFRRCDAILTSRAP